MAIDRDRLVRIFLLVELFGDPHAWCETTIAAPAEFAAPGWQNPLHFAAG